MSNGNENINHINCIEGLMSEVNNHLGQIVPHYPQEKIAKEQAEKDISDFQEGTLHDLRTLCEGD